MNFSFNVTLFNVSVVKGVALFVEVPIIDNLRLKLRRS